MKKIFLLFVAFLVSLCGLNLVVEIVSKSLLLNEPDAGNNHSNLKQSLFDSKAELLILGASKANHHYIVDTLEREFQMSVCNAGVDGDNIVTSMVQFDALITRCTPKIVIIDLSAGQMADEWESFFLSHKCYYGLESNYTSVVNQQFSIVDRIKLKCSLYRFNEVFLDIIQSYAQGNANSKGFIPLVGTSLELSHKVKDYKSGDYKFGTFQEECLDHIVMKSKEMKAKIFVVNSPTLITYTNGVCHAFKNYCDRRSVPFIDYESDTTYINHPDYFRDYNHLNLKGAEVFTHDFILRIKDIVYE